AKLKAAINNKEAVEVTLRNYKKNGELFYNHLMMMPLFDSKDNLLYFLGVQYDATEQVKADEEIKRLRARLQELEK
ncbi:MAG: PAS domain-containing protein, partial [Burkholderiales bacterium]|nr:PAS domain-containing protein [Burkholderiales bacterium]